MADLFWSEINNQQARDNLRYLLPELRGRLRDYLVITAREIAFNQRAPHWVDVAQLRGVLTGQSSASATPTLQAAVALYQGEFLAGFSVRHVPVFEAWVGLLNYLTDRCLLLILDNFEHLLGGVAFLLILLQRTQAVQVLVTARCILDLQAEIVWSLEGLATPTPAALLTLPPADALRYDSVALFPHYFTAEAAAAVARATNATLLALVDHSLLRRTVSGRFDLHELVRHYAAAQFNLDPHAVTQWRYRHARYYANLSEPDSAEVFRSPAKLQWVQQELPNLRLAWLWAIAQQELWPLTQIGQGLFVHFTLYGPLQEGWDLMAMATEGVQRLPSGAPPRVEAQLLAAQSYFAFYLGRYELAASLHSSSHTWKVNC